MEVTIKETAQFFKENDNFAILCHTNPDGDTLGSGYALCGVLHNMGKTAKLFCDDKPSLRFDYLENCIAPNMNRFPSEKPDVVVAVDVAAPGLLGSLKEVYTKVDLCIDHHVSNKFYAERTLLDVEAAACSEVIWGLIKELGAEVTPAIAEAIYTGVSTDTGCFRYSNTSPKTHMIAAELMEFGIDNAKINYLMFEMKTKQRIRLENSAYSRMEYYFDGKCAITTLTADMLDGIDPEDASNVSILPKQIEGVDVGVILKEKRNDVWRMSIRTNKNIDAQLVCAKLGGGGHVRAAGCELKGGVESAKTAILAEIAKQMSL